MTQVNTRDDSEADFNILHCEHIDANYVVWESVNCVFWGWYELVLKDKYGVV